MPSGPKSAQRGEGREVQQEPEVPVNHEVESCEPWRPTSMM